MLRRLLEWLRIDPPEDPSAGAAWSALFQGLLRGPQAPEIPSPEEERDLVLYKGEDCPYCQDVMRGIEGLDLPLSFRDAGGDAAAARELRKLIGVAQIPCLVIDGVPMLESQDILAWLRAYAEHHPAG